MCIRDSWSIDSHGKNTKSRLLSFGVVPVLRAVRLIYYLNFVERKIPEIIKAAPTM